MPARNLVILQKCDQGSCYNPGGQAEEGGAHCKGRATGVRAYNISSLKGIAYLPFGASKLAAGAGRPFSCASS